MKIIDISEIKTISYPINLVYRDSSIGDVVACEPIIDRLKKISESKIGWVINRKFADLLKYHPNLDLIVLVSNREQAWTSLKILPKNINPILLYMRPRDKNTLKKYGDVLKVNKRITAGTYYNYGGLLELFSYAAGIPTGRQQPKFYLSEENYPDIQDSHGANINKYICVHCRSNRDDYGRDWDDNKWRKLSDYFEKKGLYIVEVGLEPVIKSKSNFYIDKTDVHDLQQIAHIIKNSSFFIGIDSGFAHIANALQIDGCCLVGKIKGRFYYHTPFTGKYQYSGILRAPLNKAVFHLKLAKVIEFYENYRNPFYMLKIKSFNWICRNVIQNYVVTRNAFRRLFK